MTEHPLKARLARLEAAVLAIAPSNVDLNIQEVEAFEQQRGYHGRFGSGTGQAQAPAATGPRKVTANSPTARFLPSSQREGVKQKASKPKAMPKPKAAKKSSSAAKKADAAAKKAAAAEKQTLKNITLLKKLDPMGKVNIDKMIAETKV